VKEANARGACAAAGGSTSDADLWSMDSKRRLEIISTMLYIDVIVNVMMFNVM
jgi:hypothetical protein